MQCQQLLSSWGYNRNFQLNTGRVYSTVAGHTTEGENQNIPLIAYSDYNWLKISAGIYHTMGIRYSHVGDAHGSIWGFGDRTSKNRRL